MSFQDDMRSRDVDVNEWYECDWITAQTSCSTDYSTMSSQLVSFDDDEPEKYLDIDERGRREY